MTTKYIFGKPDCIDGVGEIYPIKLKDYDEFIDCSNHLYISKSHFGEDFQQFPLLELLVHLKDESIITDLEKVLSLVTQRNVLFFAKNENEIEYGFELESGEIINNDNFEQVREVIMKQNLMFEQKIYKDKIVQEYMNKVFQARAKSSVKMEFEDMITTVSVFAGKHYWDLAEYTVYQLKSDFNRISKIMNYKTGIAFKCVSTEPVEVEHFAENVDMFKSPYDLDQFTKSKDKVNKLDSALNK